MAETGGGQTVYQFKVTGGVQLKALAATAASRGSKMMADSMGIVMGDLGAMYEAYAKGLGKSKDELTDQERTLAFVQKMVAEGGGDEHDG